MAACGMKSSFEEKTQDKPEADASKWLKQFCAAQGTSPEEITSMCGRLDNARKDAADVAEMISRYNAKSTLSPGEAYKNAVTNLTRIFGSIDRVFKMGANPAFELTLKEYRDGYLNPVTLENSNEQRDDLKETEAAKTTTWADVEKTGITFDVFPEKELGPRLQTKSVRSLTDKEKCHGLGEHNTQVVKKFGHGKRHGFIQAAIHAWSEHYPLELCADDFWILILQGITTHVEQNSEALRSKFVNFKGKKTLEVQDNSLWPKNLKNDWTTSIDDWVKLIERNLVTDALNVSFSSTTRIAQVVQRVCVMDACKSFFTYRCMTRCGFPKITLRGKKEDWEALVRNADRAVKELCLPDLQKTWLPALNSVLPKFVECWDPKTEVDTHFWDRMIKLGAQHGSGGYSWYTGWFNVFFPFLGNGQKNKFCSPYDKSTVYETEGRMFGGPPGKGGVRGPDVGDFPTGQAAAPVEWEYYGKQIPVELKAGFFGVVQNPKTRALRPFLNWAMVEKTPEKKESRW